MFSTRHWNVERHIQRRHGGRFEPVSDDIIYYNKKIKTENTRFPLGQSQSTPLSFVTLKENSRFTHFVEDKLLLPLRKAVEYKNLLNQLSLLQQQQPTTVPVSVHYETQPHMTFDVHSTNTISGSNNIEWHLRLNDLTIIGYRADVCQKCLIIYTYALFSNKNAKSEIVATKHKCNSKRLSDAEHEIDKHKIITALYETLPKVLKKTVKSWTKNTPFVVAIEMPLNFTANNIFDITPTNETHWASRAIKYQQQILNDQDLTDFLNKVKNTTCAFFKVLPLYQQQQKQQESTCHYYLMMITDNKIKDSFASSATAAGRF